MININLQFFGGRGSGGGKRSESSSVSKVVLSKRFSENSPETVEALKTANEAYYDPETKTLDLMVGEGGFYKPLDVSDWSEAGLKNLPLHFPNILRIYNTKTKEPLYRAAGAKF